MFLYIVQTVVLALLAEKMIASVKGSNGFLIDGYPRELAQGQEFEKSVSLWKISNTFCSNNYTAYLLSLFT